MDTDDVVFSYREAKVPAAWIPLVSPLQRAFDHLSCAAPEWPIIPHDSSGEGNGTTAAASRGLLTCTEISRYVDPDRGAPVPGAGLEKIGAGYFREAFLLRDPPPDLLPNLGAGKAGGLARGLVFKVPRLQSKCGPGAAVVAAASAAERRACARNEERHALEFALLTRLPALARAPELVGVRGRCGAVIVAEFLPTRLEDLTFAEHQEAPPAAPPLGNDLNLQGTQAKAAPLFAEWAAPNLRFRPTQRFAALEPAATLAAADLAALAARPLRHGLSARWVAEVARDVARALALLHAHGVVHTDLRLSQLLVRDLPPFGAGPAGGPVGLPGPAAPTVVALNDLNRARLLWERREFPGGAWLARRPAGGGYSRARGRARGAGRPGKWCPFRVPRSRGKWRSPEELQEHAPLTEKV